MFFEMTNSTDQGAVDVTIDKNSGSARRVKALRSVSLLALALGALQAAPALAQTRVSVGENATLENDEDINVDATAIYSSPENRATCRRGSIVCTLEASAEVNPGSGLINVSSTSILRNSGNITASNFKTDINFSEYTFIRSHSMYRLDVINSGNLEAIGATNTVFGIHVTQGGPLYNANFTGHQWQEQFGGSTNIVNNGNISIKWIWKLFRNFQQLLYF